MKSIFKVEQILLSKLAKLFLELGLIDEFLIAILLLYILALSVEILYGSITSYLIIHLLAFHLKKVVTFCPHLIGLEIFLKTLCLLLKIFQIFIHIFQCIIKFIHLLRTELV